MRPCTWTGIPPHGVTLLIPTIFTTDLYVITLLFALATFSYASFTTIANVLPSDLYWSESVASVSGLSGTGAGIGTILAFKLIGYFSDVRPATTHLFDPIVGVAELSRSLACFWSYCWFETRKPQGEDLYDRSKAVFLVDYFLTTAATQLISTSEFPGSAATATVVRAGPPFGK